MTADDGSRPLLPAPVRSASGAQAQGKTGKKGMSETDFEAWRQSLKGRDILRANVWETLDSGARRSGREQADLLMQTLKRFREGKEA